MDVKYSPAEIEPKWQDFWETNKIYQTPKSSQNKKYILDMFPYPSGAGLHVGHIEGYTGTDVLSRFYRMKGFNVLHPIGWDAFGLPAENYAIKKGIAPDKSTHDNIKMFKSQIKRSGLSYDWEKEIDSSSPDYYKWTQWLFISLFKHRLAYKKMAPANWCPKDETVLANEQVVDGKCERCGTEVIQKDLEQWFFKITDFSDRLIDGLEKVDWPKSTALMQKNWIGKKKGATIKFSISNSQFSIKEIEVFTTRPDTIFGVSFLAIAPEHPLALELSKDNAQLRDYLKKVQTETSIQREHMNKDKTGVDTGLKAINPVNGEEVSIFVADYVLLTTGTGGVMGVPAHDQRDFEFAKKFKLPISRVISGSQDLPFTGEGTMENSGPYNGLKNSEVLDRLSNDFSEKIKPSANYHLRDWLVSRQRYWGAPIPMIYCQKCDWNPVPEDQLPVLLPTDVDFTPTGESPIAKSQTFQQGVACPICHGPARREVDTMDTFVDSSWYFLRFCDPSNDREPWDKKEVSQWAPVDVYVGGAEHTVLHLMYSRFFYKFFYDLGMVDKTKGDEPFLKLRHPGTVLGPDSRKMSKRWGNVINPNDVIDQYGADTLRMYELFMGPFEGMKPWSVESVAGVFRFLARVNVYYFELKHKITENKKVNLILEKNINKLVKKVTEDIENFSFNTSVAAMMGFLNEMTVGVDEESGTLTWREIWEKFLLILAPFAPFLADELFCNLTNNGQTEDYKSIHQQSWPAFDSAKLTQDKSIIAVLVNGKLRATLEVEAQLSQEEIEKLAFSHEKIKKNLENAKIKKVVYVKGKILNFVI